MPADGPPDLGDDAFLPSKPRAPAISRAHGVGGPDLGRDPFPRSVNNKTGSPAKLPGAGDEDDMMRKMGFGSFATGRFVKKMGKDGLQKSIDAAEVDLTQVHDSLKRPSGDKEELRRMMEEMTAASKGLLPARTAAGLAPNNEVPGASLQAPEHSHSSRAEAKEFRPHAGTSDMEEEEDQDEEEEQDDADDDSDDEEDMGKGSLVPCSHEAILKASTKAILAMSLDPSAARVVVGGHEYSIKMYDFNGMNQSLNHFREITVWEGQPLVDIQYSNSGDKILVATTKNTAVLYNREGGERQDFKGGDMYVHDMAQTKGHVAALCGARWHPTDRNACLTASGDGTVRLWDVNSCDKKQVTVIKTKNIKGQKATPSAVCYSPNGDIVAACDDGAIKVYDGRAVAKGSTQRAHNEAKTAHQPGSRTTSVCVSRDGNTLVSRGGDDTLKVWDMRKLSVALKEFDGLDNFFETTQCIFSPGDHLILTGTSARKSKDGASAGEACVHVIDKTSLTEVRRVGVPSGSIVSLAWHHKINQLLVGTSGGQVHCLYDPQKSTGGILRAVGKAVKKADVTSVGIGSVGHIYTPHALPAFRDDKCETKAKQKRKERADPIKSKKPDLGPIAAQQKGLSYPGEMSSRSFAQHTFKNLVGPSGQAYLQQDPREALLQYAEVADKNPIYMGVYKEVEPEKKFDTSEERMEKRAKPYFY